MTTSSLKRRRVGVGAILLPVAIAALAASAAFAGADTTFAPALTKFTLFVACGAVGNNADRGNGRAALCLAGFWIAGDTANEDNKICHGYSPEFCIRDHPGCEPDRRSGQQALAPQILRGTP